METHKIHITSVLSVCLHDSTVVSFTELHTWKSSACMFTQLENLARTNNKSSMCGASTWWPWAAVLRRCTALSGNDVINQIWACSVCFPQAKRTFVSGVSSGAGEFYAGHRPGHKPVPHVASYNSHQFWFMVTSNMTIGMLARELLYPWWHCIRGFGHFEGRLASLSILNLSNPYELFNYNFNQQFSET
jgi:hypothetical protein